MSGVARKKVQVSKELIDFSQAIIYADHPAEKVRTNQALVDNMTPSLLIALVDELVQMSIPLPELKTGINKLLNLFHKVLSKHPSVDIPEGSILDYLKQNNLEMEKRLKKLRPLIRNINQNKHDIQVKNDLLYGFQELEPFDNHYVIKENILFPVLEKKWPDYRCLQLMWSFHDDIRNNRKKIIAKLKKNDLHLEQFNKLSGDLFFNMLAIKFREEQIIFPEMLRSITNRDLNQMLDNSQEFRYPYVQPEFKSEKPAKKASSISGGVNLETGIITAKQIKLIFNHLPVDITFVDEHNKVRFYSTPKKRIFPRAKSVIGRDVRNCHPPESVHVVEEIISEFRKGRQGKASFWISLGEEYVLVQYFAVRDSKDNYCGVVEVSQEISDIRKIKGEQRLPDWSK